MSSTSPARGRTPASSPCTPCELGEHDLTHLDAYTVVARLVVDGRRTPAFTMTTRPPKPIIGEAAAIRQIAAASVPPQDISAMDQLVDRYSRGDAGSRRGEHRDRGTGRTGAPS